MVSPAIFKDYRWKSLRNVSASVARNDISELIRDAERGSRILVTRSGKPVVAVVPLTDLALLFQGDAEAERRLAKSLTRRPPATDENTVDFDVLVGNAPAPAPPRDLDALQLLAADHRKIEELFASFEAAHGAAAKERIVKQVCTQLKIHSQIEEEIFYPEIRGKVEEDALDEAYVEHDSAKVLINELEAAEPNEEFYDAKVKVLSELIEHHVREEEKQRDNLFQQTRAAGIDLKELGARLAARKAELTQIAERNGLQSAALSTLRHEKA